MDSSSSQETMEKGKVDWRGRPAKKGVHGGLLASLFILGTFVFHTSGWVALPANFVSYFTGVMHFDLATASKTLTNFMGMAYILAMFVAYLADVHFGRCRIILFSFSIFISGLLLLTVQAHFPSLKPPPCDIFDTKTHCEKVHGGNAVLLHIALYSMAIGLAGIFAGAPSHGADQFDEKDPVQVKHMSSYFNYLTGVGSLGSFISLTLVVWFQNQVGWDWGFGISLAFVFLGALIFVSGLPKYRIHVVGGSNPILQLLQVLVAAARNWRLSLPKDSVELYEIQKDTELAKDEEFLPHRDIYRFLDKAAIQRTNSETNENPNPWKLCRVTQVENAKTVVGMLPIFFCSIFMSTSLAQLQTFAINQGLTMDNRFGKHFRVAPANLGLAPTIFVIIGIPIYDRLIVPLLRKITGHPKGMSDLKRIGVGLVLCCLSLILTAIIEVKRKKVAETYGMVDANPSKEKLPISIFWLAFPHFVFGISDMFAYVGLTEFYYSEAPKTMKSIATAFLWCSLGLGYFLSSVLVDVVNHVTKNNTKSGGWLAGNNINRNHVDLFFWTLSILTFLNFLNYLFWSRRYQYNSRPMIISQVEISRS